MWNSMAFMIKYINKKWWLLLGYIALILECLTPIIAVLLQRDLIDQVFINQQYQLFAKLLALYAVFFFGPKLWFTIRKVTFFHISYHLQMSLTDGFLRKIYTLPNEQLEKEDAGKLLNNIRNDIADASDATVNQMLSESVFVIVTILFLVASITYINFSVLIYVLVVALVYYFLLHFFGAKTKAYAHEIRAARANVSVTVEESVSAVREIVAFNRQDWQMKRYLDRFQRYYKALLKEGIYKSKILFVSEPFLYGTKLIVILFGGMHVISSKISLGDFVISFTLVDQLVTALGQLFQISLAGKRLVAPVACIQSLMNKDDSAFGIETFVGEVKSIAFKEVCFSYKKDLEPVIHNLSIDFPVGKKIAFVGASGSGKSTLAQLLLRRYTPDSGHVQINGVSVHAYGDQYTDKVSVVFQQPHFIPTTIKENLVFNGVYEWAHIEMICKEMHCHEFIDGFPDKYDTEVGERGTRLSGGQKQRIALARALIKNTEVLILDEATAALDTETEYIVQQNIDKLRKGKTTIIIAHRLSSILNADYIYVFDKGSVVAEGTHESLLAKSDVYRKLYVST